MTAPLFRTEALAASRTGWLGMPAPATASVLWLATLLAIAAAVALTVFLILGEYTRRARVAGRLVPDLGLATVAAPTAGVVDRIFQQEGARVEAGAPLLLVRMPRALATGTDALDALRDGLRQRRLGLQRRDDAQAAQHAVQLAGYQGQLAAARRELAQIGVEAGHRREQLRIARENLARYERVAEARYVSQVQLHQQRQAVLELAGQEQALLRQSNTIRRDVLRLEQALRELPALRAAERAGHALELADLERERIDHEAAGERLLRAPVAGLVAHRMIEPGQAVQPGQPLLSLLPRTSRLQARLQVPSRAIGSIAPGDRVLLRYAAYPHQKFGHHGGRVLRISRSAADADAASGMRSAPDAPGADDTHYRVLVALDRQDILAYGRREPLRPDMRLEADILGERRRLYEWLLEPLYALRGRLSAASAGAG